jgi:hypothetical protein
LLFSEGTFSTKNKGKKMEPIDCEKPPYYCESNYNYAFHNNAFNDPDLSLEAKLVWSLITERGDGFDYHEYFDSLEPLDVIYAPFVELLQKGYFTMGKLEIGMGG